MNRTQFLALLAAGAAACFAPVTLARAAGPDAPEAIAKNIMEATKDKAYDRFLADANDDVRANITKQMFDGVSNQLAPRLRQGYKMVYLTRLRQGGMLVHLWRLEFSDGKDELLLRVAISKDTGKVSGMVVQ